MAAGVGTPRERAIAIAADAWAAGRLRYAAALLEAALLTQPADALVIRLLHDAYYVLGDARGLRDSPARTLQVRVTAAPPATACACTAVRPTRAKAAALRRSARRSVGTPPCRSTAASWAWLPLASRRTRSTAARRSWRCRCGRLCGVDASLCGRRHAPTLPAHPLAHPPRQALGSDEGDVWAMHAALHCFEMTSRLNEGGRLVRETRATWEGAELLRHHVLWHWCLLSLEGGEFDVATARYDASMAGDACRPSVFSAGDAAALMWRLELLHRPALCPPLPAWSVRPRQPGPGGVSRWADIARRLRPFTGQHVAPLNDVHIAMALAGAGDGPALDAHIASMAAHAADGCGGGCGGGGSGRRRAAEAAADASASPAALPGDLRRGAERSVHSRPLLLPFGHGDGSGGGAERKGLGGAEPASPASASTRRADAPASPLLAAAATHDVREALRCAGVGAAQGVAAFAAGDAAAAATHLLRTRPYWAALGGSFAQRDVLEQTLIHAAADGGDLPLARALLSERAAARFASPQAWFMLGAVHAALGDEGRARDAGLRAAALGLGQGGGGGRRRL